MQCDAHIDDVACAQIDFGRTTRAFSNHHIEARPQVVERIGDHRPEIALGAVEVLACGLNVAHLAADDNLCSARLRLEQDGIHVHGRSHARGGGLGELGPPDLAAARTDGGIVRHVLGFERCYAQVASSEQATQSGNERALADGRGGALNHEYRCQVLTVSHRTRATVSIRR